MKIKSIKKFKEEETWDLEVDTHHSYILENGIVSHNSSMWSNSTSGIEPPRKLASSKKGVTKLVPGIRKYKNYYTTAWGDDFNNIDYFKFIAVMQKFLDQAVSTNQYHNLVKTGGKKKKSLLIKETLTAIYYGLKTLYYSNIRSNETKDGEEEPEAGGCAGGGCIV